MFLTIKIAPNSIELLNVLSVYEDDKLVYSYLVYNETSFLTKTSQVLMGCQYQPLGLIHTMLNLSAISLAP